MRQPLISIVVLNWNGKQHLDTCFTSIQQQTYRNFECLLVDNGSSDGSVAFVREKFPWVKIIALKENVGFAKGNNEGIKKARVKYILTLNNDTKMDKNCLRELAMAIARHPEAGMFSLKMMFFYEKNLINSTGTLVYWDGAAMNRGMKEKDRGPYEQEEEILGPCAGAGVYKKEMLEDIKIHGEYFDGTFFIYLEDVELSWRAQLRKWKAYYVPQAVIYHVHSATMEAKSPRKLYLSERNRIWYTFKVFPFQLFLISPLFTLLRYMVFLAARKKALQGKKSNPGEKQHTAFDYFLALCKAWFHAMAGLPSMMAKRHYIRTTRKISNKEFFVLMREYRAKVSVLISS